MNMDRVPEELVKLNPEFFSEESFGEQCNNIIKCIPFVGAGMSVDFGLPTWAGFIRQLAKRQNNLSLVKVLDENKDNNEFDFEEAASKVYRKSVTFAQYGSGIFNKKITDEQIDNSSVKILPKLFGDSNIITTNYDNVLSQVYGRNNQHMQVINYTESENVTAAMFIKEKCIIKLHGSFDIGGKYVFTKEQYDKVYSDIRFNKVLSSVLTKGSLFFWAAA